MDGSTSVCVARSPLSDDDVQRFQTDGCLHVRGLYSSNEIDSAWRAVDAAMPTEGSRSSIWGFSNAITSIGPGFASTAVEWNLFQKPDLVAAVRRLVTDKKVLWHDVTGTLVVAWPGQEDGTWVHLDYGGETLTQEESLVYGMIYLTDVDESGARTKVVPGSHTIVRNHLVAHPTDPRNTNLQDDVMFLNLDKAIPVDVEAGDVLLFDHLLAHSGGGQRGAAYRPVLRVGFTNGEGCLRDRLVTVPASVEVFLTSEGRSLARPV